MRGPYQGRVFICSPGNAGSHMERYYPHFVGIGKACELIRALGYVAEARGMAQVAVASGSGRESLYKALSPGAKPRFDTVLKVIRALGIDLLAMPHTTPHH